MTDYKLNVNDDHIGSVVLPALFTVNEAIALHREVLDLREKDHPDYGSTLNSLAIALRERFYQVMDPADLDEAAKLQRAALQLHLPDHPEYIPILSSLAVTLTARYYQAGDLADFNEAVALHREALRLCPRGHPRYWIFLNNLASVLLAQYKEFGNDTVLAEAVQLSEEDVKARPGAWRSQYRLVGLRSQQGTAHYDPAAALQLLSELLKSPLGTTQTLLQLAVSRLSKLSTYDLSPACQEQIVGVYQQAIALMPRAAYLGLSLSQRLKSIVEADPTATMAACHALKLNQIPLALELLEQGRAVFWHQAQQLRSPVHDPHLSQELIDEINGLMQVLDTEPVLMEPQMKLVMEADAANRWKKSQRLEELLQQVNDQLDTEGTLHPLPASSYDTLVQAAQKGPVVVLLSTVVWSGAVIIKQGGTTSLVHLPEAFSQWLQEWTESWKEEIKEARAYFSDSAVSTVSTEVSRAARLNKFQQDGNQLLADLWSYIVEPIVRSLKDEMVCITL